MKLSFEVSFSYPQTAQRNSFYHLADVRCPTTRRTDTQLPCSQVHGCATPRCMDVQRPGAQLSMHGTRSTPNSRWECQISLIQMKLMVRNCSCSTPWWSIHPSIQSPPYLPWHTLTPKCQSYYCSLLQTCPHTKSMCPQMSDLTCLHTQTYTHTCMHARMPACTQTHTHTH